MTPLIILNYCTVKLYLIILIQNVIKIIKYVYYLNDKILNKSLYLLLYCQVCIIIIPVVETPLWLCWAVLQMLFWALHLSPADTERVWQTAGPDRAPARPLRSAPDGDTCSAIGPKSDPTAIGLDPRYVSHREQIIVA